MKTLNKFIFHIIAIQLMISWTHISAANKTVPPIPNSGHSTFEVHRHNNLTGSQENITENRSWSSGWSFIKTYRVGIQNYLFLLKSKNGKAHIRRLNSDGSLGSTVGNYSLMQDVSSVEFFKSNEGTVLIMTQRQTGRVVVRKINFFGRLGATLQDIVSPYLKHRDVMKPYRVGLSSYLFTVDRWHGRASVLKLDNDGTLINDAPQYDKKWTRGWSHVEFYVAQGKTYALLYKTESVFNLGQGGKFGIKQVNASGLLDAGWVQEPSTWSRGYTQFEIMQVPTPPKGIGGIASAPGTAPILRLRNVLFIYKVHSGAAKAIELGEAGIGEQIWSGNIGSGWTGLTSYAADNKAYVAKINEENLEPFDYTMVRKMRDAVDAAYNGKVVGYQLGIMQSGRIVHLHGAGLKNRELNLPMTTLDRQSLASVSKMLTAVTVLKMVEDGDLDLNDRMVDYLYLPNQTPHEELYYLPEDQLMDPSLEDVRIIELLTYTARFASSSSSSALWAGSRIASACDANLLNDTSWIPNPSMRCNDGYQNSAYGIAGFIAMQLANVTSEAYENTTDWQQFNWDYWMRDVHLDGMHCTIPSTDTMGSYTACMPGSANCNDGFKTNVVEDPGYCLSGSWRGNSEDLLYLLSAMRYGKILGSEMTNLLLSKTLQSFKPSIQQPNIEGSVALGWNSGAVNIAGTDEKGLRKAGGAGGVAAYVYHLPRNVDVALIMNTNGCSTTSDPCPSLEATIREAFELAIEQ